MKHPTGTIRRRLVTAMMLTSTIVLLLTGAVMIVYDVVSYRRSLVRMLVTRAQIVAANSTAALAFENPDDARRTLRALRTDPSMQLGALYDRKGRLFATHSDSVTAPDHMTRAHETSYRFEDASLVVLQPVVEDGRWLGTLYLKSDLRALSERLRLFLAMVLVAVLGSIGVAFALATWLQRGITTPVRALAEAARRVSHDKDYSVRANVTSDGELGLMTEAFNDMIATVQQREAERRQAEQEIRELNADLENRVRARTAELEALNRELEAFSYSVSHDLRAPLRHINGFADLLHRNARATLDDKSRHYLDHISDAARKMGQLIDDLLTFSRMGRLEMGATRVSLSGLVDEVRRAHDQDVANRAIDWHVASLPAVEADPAMLRVVLTNLISNAIKYSATRDRAEITIDAEGTETETIVHVRDNGVGFDMAYAGKLFGVFQRLHSPEDFEGTGIGLANVRRIVQRHGGRTWAEGAVDRGATFSFSLPRRDRMEQTPNRGIDDRREAA